MNALRPKTACFTGHRHVAPGDVRMLRQKLIDTVIGLYKRGYRYFGAGGALGFDTMAAQTVLDLRKEYSDIRLILVLPCGDQSREWTVTQRGEYERIRGLADKEVVLFRTYNEGCMQARNRHLVDHSSVCITYCRRATGGTVYTRNYAVRQGLELIDL
ncbi:MAG: DUF1273 family protein [Clostridia bacterium]|nr:DUF1273 family protein [Clostridia bacterium]